MLGGFFVVQKPLAFAQALKAMVIIVVSLTSSAYHFSTFIMH
jgi:hypothetical protein